MTQKQQDYKKLLVMQVHRTKLWFDVYSHDRELYETMLVNNFGVKSSKELDIDNLKKLIKFLNGGKMIYTKPNVGAITKNQALFLITLWRQNARNKDDEALLKLIYKRFKISLNSIYELKKGDFKKVVAVLKNIQEAVIEAGTIEYSKTKLRLIRKGIDE